MTPLQVHRIEQRGLIVLRETATHILARDLKGIEYSIPHKRRTEVAPTIVWSLNTYQAIARVLNGTFDSVTKTHFRYWKSGLLYQKTLASIKRYLAFSRPTKKHGAAETNISQPLIYGGLRVKAEEYSYEQRRMFLEYHGWSALEDPIVFPTVLRCPAGHLVNVKKFALSIPNLQRGQLKEKVKCKYDGIIPKSEREAIKQGYTIVRSTKRGLTIQDKGGFQYKILHKHILEGKAPVLMQNLNNIKVICSQAGAEFVSFTRLDGVAYITYELNDRTNTQKWDDIVEQGVIP